MKLFKICWKICMIILFTFLCIMCFINGSSFLLIFEVIGAGIMGFFIPEISEL